MTEPQGGSDPTKFVTTAKMDGNHWRIDGEKWFLTNGKWTDFLIVMAVTDPDAQRHEKMSMFIVAVDTPGVEIIRNVGVYGQESGSESYIRYTDVEVPSDHLLGERGGAFAISQTRLDGGRVHQAMRTVGLLVLKTACMIEKYQDYRKVRKDIPTIKALIPGVYHNIAQRCIHIIGSLGVSNEMPFLGNLIGSTAIGMSAALQIYFGTYLWGLSSTQLAILILDSLVEATLSLFLAPYLSRKLGALPYIPRLMGLFFENGDPRCWYRRSSCWQASTPWAGHRRPC